MRIKVDYFLYGGENPPVFGLEGFSQGCARVKVSGSRERQFETEAGVERRAGTRNPSLVFLLNPG
jgi:hypothetical protein